MNGSAPAGNWINAHANAVLEAWYPGEEGGAAVAETLSSKNNPAGRLRVTPFVTRHFHIQTQVACPNSVCTRVAKPGSMEDKNWRLKKLVADLTL
jgi:hypothetical protein